jgi:DNA-binding CsgD family transcriptional regulator
MAECLIGFAALALANDLPAAAARILSAAVAFGGQHITSEWAATRLEYEFYLERARAGLTQAKFQAELEAGQELTLEQAVAYAQDGALKAMAARESQKKPGTLTPRERQVAALIARGETNGEIAGELVVSKRTVESHVANIRSKLGFTNRAQIVRWAFESGEMNPAE